MSYRSWDDIAKEQKVVARLLSNHLKLNRLNHAYIFEGAKGTKKHDIARFFTKALICQHKDEDMNPCHQCNDCQRIDHQTHPNVFVVEPDGQMIKKEQIKKMIDEFSKTSLESGPRVNIFLEADKFNLSSANAFLKTMEEPGKDIYQIMITENLQALLPTIRSRGEIVHFKELNRKLIKKHLEDKGIKASYANPIAQYTADLSAAEAIANDDLSIEIIDLVIGVYEALVDRKQSAVITFLEHGGKVMASIERTEFFLDFMILFQKDIIQSKLNQVNMCYNKHHHLIENICKVIDMTLAQKHLEEMLELSKRMKYNINIPLAMNYLLMVLERGYKHAT
jgi:DNA polymerase-3 subunit delta'